MCAETPTGETLSHLAGESEVGSENYAAVTVNEPTLRRQPLLRSRP